MENISYYTITGGEGNIENIRETGGTGAFRTQVLSSRRRQKWERGIRQRRFWEHVIRDETNYERHVDYIHYNPVKHGYVTKVAKWPYSSFHRYVRNGMYSLDWAADVEIWRLEKE